MQKTIIEIFSDGSCNTKLKIGAWVAIILVNHQEITLNGMFENTTNNQMELIAVIEAICYIDNRFDYDLIKIYTDSQYVANLTQRMDKLTDKNFITNKGKNIQNSELVQKLINQIKNHNLEFVKVKAHQKSINEKSIIYNRKVDILARKMVREKVDSIKFD